MKKRYMSDGVEVAQRLMKNSDILAVWLSGPFAPPRISPGSDLHMGVLARNVDAVTYHHVLSPFSGVGRRLEIAFFPHNYFESLLENGLRNWVDIFDLHKLSDIEILHEKDEVLGIIKNKMEQAKPTRLFIGKQIESLRLDYMSFKQSAGGGKRVEGTLLARTILMNTLMILVLIVSNLTFSKLSHLYPKIESLLPLSKRNLVDHVLALKNLNKEDAAKVIEKTNILVESLFERLAICGDASN